MYLLLTILFWISLVGVFYAYVGYPFLIFAISQLLGRKHGAREFVSDESLPDVTVVIAAYNAAQHIGDRIANLLESNYPLEKLNIVVASDGSTDATVATVRAMAVPNLRVMDLDRRGKSKTLAAAVDTVTTEVLVFTDASTMFDPAAIRNLVCHFIDPLVGVAAGKVVMIDEAGQPCESLYWRTEMTVRQCEASLQVPIGASGAIYAIRRSMFVKPSKPIINDDMVLPMLTKMVHRCRFVLDTGSIAFAVSSGGIGAEFRRRCRIGAGGFQSLSELNQLWQWKNRRILAAFASHKLMRWLCPLLLVLLFLTNCMLLPQMLYSITLVIQLAGYAIAIAGVFVRGPAGVSSIARIAASFAAMNLALAVGFTRWIRDPNNVIWAPTKRPCWHEIGSVASSTSADVPRAA